MKQVLSRSASFAAAGICFLLLASSAFACKSDYCGGSHAPTSLSQVGGTQSYQPAPSAPGTPGTGACLPSSLTTNVSKYATISTANQALLSALPACTTGQKPGCVPSGLTGSDGALISDEFLTSMDNTTLLAMMHSMPTAAAQAAFFLSAPSSFQNYVETADFGDTGCNCTAGALAYHQWVNYYAAQGPLPGSINPVTGQVGWNWTYPPSVSPGATTDGGYQIVDPAGGASVTGGTDTGSTAINGWFCP